MRVLVAEDDSTSRKLLTYVLQGWGYEVHAVLDGRHALDGLMADDPAPMAILDWEMPELDGVEVCRLSRATVTPSPPYIILLTARSAKEDIVAGLDAGANDFLTKPFHKEELRARVEVGRRFVELNRELLASREQLQVQALTDALTGIMNRRAILQMLAHEMARAERTGDTLAVGMMDIDFFKHINDTYGHAAGDEVLLEVVRRSTAVLRAADSLGRFGGDEFLLILGGADAEAVEHVLKRVRQTVSASPVVAGDHDLELSVSIGGAVWRGESIDHLIRAADDALYAVKARGRNQVVMAPA